MAAMTNNKIHHLLERKLEMLLLALSSISTGYYLLCNLLVDISKKKHEHLSFVKEHLAT